MSLAADRLSLCAMHFAALDAVNLVTELEEVEAREEAQRAERQASLDLIKVNYGAAWLGRQTTLAIELSCRSFADLNCQFSFRKCSTVQALQDESTADKVHQKEAIAQALTKDTILSVKGLQPHKA